MVKPTKYKVPAGKTRKEQENDAAARRLGLPVPEDAKPKRDKED